MVLPKGLKVRPTLACCRQFKLRQLTGRIVRGYESVNGEMYLVDFGEAMDTRWFNNGRFEILDIDENKALLVEHALGGSINNQGE